MRLSRSPGTRERRTCPCSSLREFHILLQFTTDFRSVYTTVTSGVLGIDPKAVLLGQTFPTIPFI